MGVYNNNSDLKNIYMNKLSNWKYGKRKFPTDFVVLRQNLMTSVSHYKKVITAINFMYVNELHHL